MKRFILINLFFLSNIAVFIQAAETGETQKKGMLSGITGIFKRKKTPAPQWVITKIQSLEKKKEDLKDFAKEKDQAFIDASNRLENPRAGVSPEEQYLAFLAKKTASDALKNINKQIREIDKELNGYDRKYILPLGLQETR